MNINDYTDFENVTIADFHEAIFYTKKNIQKYIKEKKFKEALEQIKIYLKLNQLLDKKSFSVRKK